MRVKLTRKTGFWGIGSGLKVFKNGQQDFLLMSDETKEFDIDDEEVKLSVASSILKSPELQLINNQAEKNLQVIINPMLFKLYMSLFTLVFILPLIFRSWQLGIGILALYILFVAVMASKFYIIEEIN